MMLKIKIFFILISLLFVQNGEAQLRCLSLFQSEKDTYAQAIDSINSDSNKNIFSTDLARVLNPDTTEANIWQDFKLRNQAHRLAKQLKKLKDAKSWSTYDFDNFSKKLSKISFLTDSNVTKTMTRTEKIIFLQARHDALSRGLENYFFQNTTTPPVVRRQIFRWMMVPFQRVYWRWAIAAVNAPKLNGRVMTAADASALLWSGPQGRPDLVQKYSFNFKDKPLSFYLNIFSTAQAKHYFNSASTLYNYGILAMALGSLPLYGYLTFYELQETGTVQAVELYRPGLESSEMAAKVDQHQFAAERDLNNALEKARLILKREPTEDEIAQIKMGLQNSPKN